MDLLGRLTNFANQVGELIADDVGAHVELGAALLERGDPTGAIHELTQATKRRPDHARALYLLGLAYLKRAEGDDLALARKSLGAAIAAREGYAEAMVALAELHEREGDTQGAKEGYRKALPLVTSDDLRVEIERRLGALYLRIGRLDKAIRELRKAVSKDPEDAESQGLLGQALVRSARERREPEGGPTWETARLCLLRAARADKPSAQALSALGSVFLSAGQLADAEQALRRALQIDQGCVPALIAVGHLRLRQGDEAAAMEQALRAAAAARSYTPAEVYVLLARCQERLGKIERALLSYDQAIAVLGSALSSATADALPAATGALEDVLQEALHLALRQGHFAEAAQIGAHPLLATKADGLAAQAQHPQLGDAPAEALLGKAMAQGETLEVRLAEARLHLRRGAHAKAALSLRRASTLGPTDERPRRLLSSLYAEARTTLPKELYGLLQATQRHFSSTQELAALVGEASLLISTLDRPLLLCVMGEFNSGKSTFVNALLGEEVAPMGILPTTATINVLKYGRERGGRVVYRDDRSREVTWDEVPALLKAVDEEEARHIRLVEVLYPLDILQRVNVVDTPGLNSILPEHEETARHFIAEADAVVWLFSVDQAGKASEREALQAIRDAGKQVLGVVNKIDRLGPEQTKADQGPLFDILSHLRDPNEGMGELLQEVVPFSGRQALAGRKRIAQVDPADPSHKEAKEEGDQWLVLSNLDALWRALDDRFFARSQAIKQQAARVRLLALLKRAKAQVEESLSTPREELTVLSQKLAAVRADGLLFLSDFIPKERRQLIAGADEVHRLAARETLDFVRPRRWPFGENQAAPADRDFLIGLLDEKLGVMLQASRARVVSALTETDEDRLRLLDEQVYGRYRAFARGYLRGGKVEDFFIRVLPRLDLSEAAIGRALERDAPTSIDILEEELLNPLRVFSEVRTRSLAGTYSRQIAEEEMRRLDLEERVLYPVTALMNALM